jgi:hypothetical protein
MSKTVYIMTLMIKRSETLCFSIRKALLVLSVSLALFVQCAKATALPLAEHVFIVSFDGGKPQVMQASHMPVLKKLIDDGAWTWTAQTVFPSTTLPSHTSMLTGVLPEKHQVLWNDWEPAKGMVRVPTVFSLAHARGLTTAMFVAKPKFIHLFLEHSLNNFSLPSYDSKTVAGTAAKYIVAKKPNLCFIHLADSDGAGHQFGWGSAEQKQAFADEDDALATVLAAITKAGIEKTSVVILTADHGGHEKTHGTKSPDDMEIPWIVWGAKVRHGYHISESVTTCDTAATALWLLDVPLPNNLDGKAIVSVFDRSIR